MLLGLTLIVSGTAKIPGQVEFADALLKSFWTPALARFISDYLPWIELFIGIFLLLGLFPRIIAALCIPLIIGFIANNSWALNKGIDKFSECACFGVLEEYLGHLSPLGAFILDIVLFVLTLVVLIFDKRGFTTFQPWFIRREKGEISI